MSRELVGHKCGRCKATVYPVIFEKTGLRMHVERTNAGNLAIVHQLPGIERDGALPRVVETRLSSSYREHTHAGERHGSFSAANFRKKRRAA